LPTGTIDVTAAVAVSTVTIEFGYEGAAPCAAI